MTGSRRHRRRCRPVVFVVVAMLAVGACSGDSDGIPGELDGTVVTAGPPVTSAAVLTTGAAATSAEPTTTVAPGTAVPATVAAPFPEPATEVAPGVVMTPTLAVAGGSAPAIVGVGEGFLLIGSPSPDSPTTHMAVSANGSDWQPISAPDNMGFVLRAAADGPSVVVLADRMTDGDVRETVSWLSVDGGTSWTEAPLPSSPSAGEYVTWTNNVHSMAVTGTRAVATGSVFPAIDWQRYVIDDLGVDHGHVTGEGSGDGPNSWVVQFEDGVEVTVELADVGFDRLSFEPRGMVWNLADGEWSAIEQPPGVLQGPMGMMAPEVTGGSEGFATVGTANATVTGLMTYDVLHSVDGTTWEPTPLPAELQGSAATVTGGPDGYVLLGPGVIYHSPDAVTWSEVHRFDDRNPNFASGPLYGGVAGGAGFALQIVDAPDGGAIVGLRVLTSPDGITWTETPVPSSYGASVAVTDTLILIVPISYDSPVPELPADRDSLLDAITAAFSAAVAGPTPAEPIATPQEAACIAAGVADSLGDDRVRQIGFGVFPWSLLGYGLGLPIETADAEAIVAVFEQCTPNWELLMITSITEGADQISRDSAECVAETLDDDVARNIFVSELARDDQQPNAPPDALEYLTTMIDAMESCLTPTELNALDFN